MNNEHYDEIGRTEDFSMMDGMQDAKLFLLFIEFCLMVIFVNSQINKNAFPIYFFFDTIF